MYYVGLRTACTDELYHHGIKGQKWGIRRFQNKDGSLTEAGIARYTDVADRGHNEETAARIRDYVEKAKQLAGIRAITGETDVISKGSKINRLTNVQESVDERRKYGSLLKTDDDMYSTEAEALPFEGGSRDLYKETYEAKKDLTVANANAVSNFLIQKYGSKTISDLANDPEFDNHGRYFAKDTLKALGKTKIKDLEVILRSSEGLKDAIHFSTKRQTEDHTLSKKEKADIADMGRLANEGQEIMRTLMSSEMYGKTKGKDIMDYFSKKGYDAIVDVEDIMGHNAEYPVIFLNPGASMKKIKSEKIW